jgi:hypothetical protein
MNSTASNISPDDIIAIAVSTARCVSLKGKIATWGFFGMLVNFNTASVTIPNVPSEPTMRCVKSYPAEDLRGRFRVVTIVPSASTTVSEITQSLIVPCRYAFVPEHPMAIYEAIAVSVLERGAREG